MFWSLNKKKKKKKNPNVETQHDSFSAEDIRGCGKQAL